MNTVYNFDSQIFSELTELEEINLVNLDMQGSINADFVKNCKKLRTLNLSHNRIEGELPNIEEWSDMKNM